MSERKVCVVGDVMLDTYHYVRPVKVSDEAPVLVTRFDRTEVALGGAGNVAFNLNRALNTPTVLCGLVRPDEAGRTIRTLAERAGVDTAGLFDGFATPTIEKFRFLDTRTGKQLLRVDYESPAPMIHVALSLSAKSMAQFMVADDKSCDTLVISDYGKRTFDPTDYTELLQTAKAYNVFSVVNGKPVNLRSYAHADVLIFNLSEAREACVVEGIKHKTPPPDDPKKQAQIYAKAIRGYLYNAARDCPTMVVTMGEHGLGMMTPNENTFRTVSVPAVVPVDVCGAGDAVTAMIAYKRTCDLETLRHAAKAARAVVSKLGAGMV